MSLELLDGLKAIQTSIEIVKAATDANQRPEDAAMADITDALLLELSKAEADVIRGIAQMKQLEKELASLKQQRQEKLIVKRGFYYTADTQEGPFCIHCYDMDDQKVVPEKLTTSLYALGEHRCPSCGNYC